MNDTRQLPLAPTAEEDMRSVTRRQINLIWERTQALIALAVVLSTLAAALLLIIRGDVERGLSLLSAAFFLVIGFYFGRTNHARPSGVRVPTL
jgi:hypothetical protein